MLFDKDGDVAILDKYALVKEANGGYNYIVSETIFEKSVPLSNKTYIVSGGLRKPYNA